MSIKTGIVRLAIKWTPKALILWVGNIALRGIAQLSDFQFDLDNRRVFVRTLLNGEVEPIELTLEDFALLQDGDGYKAILNKAESNKPWLNNIMARVTGKAIPVPDVPQLKPHMALVADLLKAPAREA